MPIFDLLFPKYCVSCRTFGSYLCPNCFSQVSFDTQVICLECGKNSLDGLTHPLCRKRTSIEGVFCGVRYNHVAKKLIYAFKYQPYVSQVKTVLIELLYESLIQKEVFIKILTAADVFVPIPLASKKFKQRGYNQSLLLAQGLSKKFSLPIADSLARVKETTSQVGLQKHERIANIKDAFTVKRTLPTGFDTVLLIDDVLTTGTTLLEATKALKRSGIKHVWGITFARD